MPTPDWAETDYDPWERPDVGSEILGRGNQQRKSKTFLQSPEHATLLSFIRGHIRMLTEVFRRLHAEHYQTIVEITNEDGKTEKKSVPHVLTDPEVRDTYPVIAEWERLHQEHVEHMVSVAGFSVRAASGYNDVEKGNRSRSRNGETSAGTDKQATGENPRWR